MAILYAADVFVGSAVVAHGGGDRAAKRPLVTGRTNSSTSVPLAADQARRADDRPDQDGPGLDPPPPRRTIESWTRAVGSTTAPLLGRCRRPAASPRPGGRSASACRPGACGTAAWRRRSRRPCGWAGPVGRRPVADLDGVLAGDQRHRLFLHVDEAGRRHQPQRLAGDQHDAAGRAVAVAADDADVALAAVQRVGQRHERVDQDLGRVGDPGSNRRRRTAVGQVAEDAAGAAVLGLVPLDAERAVRT